MRGLGRDANAGRGSIPGVGFTMRAGDTFLIGVSATSGAAAGASVTGGNLTLAATLQ